MDEDCIDFIPTKASLAKKIDASNFQIVIHESYKPKKPTESLTINKSSSDPKAGGGFNIRQAKQDVVKFGLSGFDPQKKEEAKVQLAIKLGAKPPKNKYKNYKLLKTEKKKEKEREIERLQFQQLGKTVMGKSTAKGKSFDRKRRKKKGDILDVYGKVKPTPNDKQFYE